MSCALREVPEPLSFTGMLEIQSKSRERLLAMLACERVRGAVLVYPDWLGVLIVLAISGGLLIGPR
jgi:hypothetical protein